GWSRSALAWLSSSRPRLVGSLETFRLWPSHQLWITYRGLSIDTPWGQFQRLSTLGTPLAPTVNGARATIEAAAGARSRRMARRRTRMAGTSRSSGTAHGDRVRARRSMLTDQNGGVIVLRLAR